MAQENTGMKLPWESKKELRKERERMEKEIDEKEDKVEELEKRLEAEQERRKNLSRTKQAAEEKLNRLEDRLESTEKEEEADESDEKSRFENISFRKFHDGLEKLSTMDSEAEELVTLKSQDRLSKHADLPGVKNSLPSDIYTELSKKDSLIILHDSDTFTMVYRIRPFFSDDVTIESSFSTREILDFVSKDKHWVLVSRGETRILEESEGKVEEVERITDRVNSQHGKGGFSQGRFERKRDEQVEGHLDNVEELIEDLENIYLLGDRSLCKNLPGEYLGGFDPNRSPPESLYQPRKLKD